MSNNNDTNIEEDLDNNELITNLLEKLPPYSTIEVANPFWRYSLAVLVLPNTPAKQMIFPESITIYCHSEECNRPCPFDSQSSNPYISPTKSTQEFLEYICRTCRKTSKIFSLRFESTFDVDEKIIPSTKVTKYMKITKFGEYPPFDPHTPTRLITMFGKHRDLYLRGRRSESQSLGIGAFVYYRRVIKDLKNEIIDLIIKAANTYHADPMLIAELEKAKKESEFAKSMEIIKHEFPDALKIAGENPLTALNTALSTGIHNKSDKECLELAQSVRTILCSFVERFTELSKNNDNLKKALKNIDKFKNK